MSLIHNNKPFSNQADKGCRLLNDPVIQHKADLYQAALNAARERGETIVLEDRLTREGQRLTVLDPTTGEVKQVDKGPLFLDDDSLRRYARRFVDPGG